MVCHLLKMGLQRKPLTVLLEEESGRIGKFRASGRSHGVYGGYFLSGGHAADEAAWANMSVHPAVPFFEFTLL